MVWLSTAKTKITKERSDFERFSSSTRARSQRINFHSLLELHVHHLSVLCFASPLFTFDEANYRLTLCARTHENSYIHFFLASPRRFVQYFFFFSNLRWSQESRFVHSQTLLLSSLLVKLSTRWDSKLHSSDSYRSRLIPLQRLFLPPDV